MEEFELSENRCAMMARTSAACAGVGMPHKRSVDRTVVCSTALEEERLIKPAQGVGEQVQVSRDPVVRQNAIVFHSDLKRMFSDFSL